MPSTPLQQAIRNWQTRQSQASRAGIPPAAYQDLAKADINRVLQGGTPMPDQEVNVALQSQKYGPIIAPPQPKTNLASLPGNIAGDVGGMVTGFIPGIARYVHHLPSEVMHGGDNSEPSSFSPGGLAAALRNIARDPLFTPLPLVHTAAALTTPSGRTQLLAHPVGATLDVLPLLSAAGSVAAEAALGGRAAAAGSATEALSEGRLGRAAIRGGLDTAGRITGTAPRATMAQWADNLGVSPAIREGIMRPYNIIARKTQREAISLWNREIAPTMGKLSAEERTTLFHEAANFDRPTSSMRNPDGSLTPIPADHLAILDKVQEMNDKYLRMNVDRGKLTTIPTPEGTDEVYPIDAPVAKLHRGVSRASELVTNSLERVRQATEKVADRESNLINKQGKVRRFYERPEDFAARPNGTVGFDAIDEAVRPFVESFRNLNPREVFQEYLGKIADGNVRRVVARQLGKDFDKLQGETGLVAKLDDAIKAKDLRSSQQAATEIARTFRHKGWDQFNTSQTLRSFMGDIRDELKGLNDRTRSHGYAARMHQTAVREQALAEQRLANHQSLLNSRHTSFMSSLTESIPARFQPHVTNLIREGAVTAARDLYQGQELDNAIRTLRETPSTAAMENLVGKEQFNDIMSSSVQMWRELAAGGLDPIWLHHVDPGQYESFMHGKPLPTHFSRPSQLESRVLNFGPHMEDIAASVTAAGVELIRQRGTEAFINDWVMKFARNTQELHQEYMDSMREGLRTATETLPGMAKRQLEKEWEAFDPADYGVRTTARVTRDDSIMIPKGVARSLRMIMKDYKLPLSAAYDKAMHLYKFSVLTGPRHIVHVAMGGMTMAMMREPGTILHVLEAARMIRDKTAPIDLLHPLYDIPTDGIFHFTVGKTMARHYAEAVGGGIANVAKAAGRFEEFTASVERVATMLSAEARGLDREAAMRQALKVYIDMDGMSAIERTVIRNIFPFYAFTRHIMRYLLTYPVDHPVRAAVLARYGEQEQQDWDSGLPRKYQQLFFLGQPDAKGNVDTVDFKSINPFRSIANDFTLAGFISSLNPILTSAMSAAGLNVLGATPELYPATTYDDVSGSIVAKRTDTVPKIISSFIPEFGAIDHFAQLTNRMRQLKMSSPDAYRRQLFSSLNIPFAPGQLNVPFEQEHTMINRFKAAQTAVSGAMRTGDFSTLDRFNLVPFAGQMVTPQQLATVMAPYLNAPGNVSPKAIMPTVKVKSTTPRVRGPRTKSKIGPR